MPWHLFVCFESSFAIQNAELFTLTYGAIVRQLLTDLEEVDEVNKQLDQMYFFLFLVICFIFSTFSFNFIGYGQYT